VGVTVTAPNPVISQSRTGAAQNVPTAVIETMPSIGRTFGDFARVSPQVDSGGSGFNAVGRNNKYNSIQIDGAVNNDLFGLADTGTPGGQTNTQPISLDAIDQLQLVVSPYDVRQGGFTGGGLNAVTRSGSNEYHGSIYGSTRDQDSVGDGPFDKPIADFSEDQYGLRLGGRILPDKLFFFVNGEYNRRDEPTGVSADGTTGTVFAKPEDAARFRNILIDKYSYDPGTLGDFTGATDSDLAFARLDWNLAAGHQLTLRHNYVDASRDVIADRSTRTFRFPTAIYAIADKTNSTVAQLNSVFGSSFNEARVGYQTIKDVRDVPVVFPSVEVGGTGPRSGELNAGTERFSGANSLDQEILELTDDFTFLKGSHTITVGTHNEFFKFKNLFLSDFYGYYYFPTLDDFDNEQASQYSITYATGSDPRRPTSFKVQQYGLYGGDQWRVNDRVSLTLGLRLDMAQFPDSPSYNPIVDQAIGFRTDATPSEDPVVSPRVGFNWDPDGQGKQQLRGGIGIFAGRTPYVWISNAFANTGIESVSRTFSVPSGSPPSIPFVSDPLNQPRNLGSAGSLSVDLVDPNFELPRVLRTTLGYDRELVWGIRGTAEVVYSETEQDIYYQNVNKVATGSTAFDGRPTFMSKSPALRDAILLTNTGKGDELMATIQLSRPLIDGLALSALYAYMDAESAFDGTSSRAISNWQFMPVKGDIFSPENSTSSFEIEHRFSFSATYNIETGPVGHTFALYYNVASGRPYSLLMGGDPNKDGYSTNDLLYVPASPDEIILKDSTGAVIPYSRFADFLRQAGVGETSGSILDRNVAREPWSHLLDFHYGLDIPIKVVRTEVTFDILNLLNLIDKDMGVVRYVSNQSNTPVTYRGIDAATGKPIYQEASSGALNPGRQFSTADLRSRWQAKLGLRVSF
jgi:hypothetical protein